MILYVFLLSLLLFMVSFYCNANPNAMSYTKTKSKTKYQGF